MFDEQQFKNTDMDHFFQNIVTLLELVEEIEFALYDIIEIFFRGLTLIANYIFGCKFECLEGFLNKNLNDIISFINEFFELEDLTKVGLIENLKSCYNGTVSRKLEFLNCSIPANSSISGGDGKNSCSNLKNFFENNKKSSSAIYQGFKNYLNDFFHTFAETNEAVCQNQLDKILKSTPHSTTENPNTTTEYYNTTTENPNTTTEYYNTTTEYYNTTTENTEVLTEGFDFFNPIFLIVIFAFILIFFLLFGLSILVKRRKKGQVYYVKFRNQQGSSDSNLDS